MSTYRKKAITTEQQVELLIRRGMRVSDPGRAQQILTHINYYRLRPYWLSFETTPKNSEDHSFIDTAEFATVLAIYDFDRELRLLLLDAIERIEISLRTRLANELSLRHGPFAHQDQSLLVNSQAWLQLNRELLKKYKGSNELFAQHYRNKYPQLLTPPSWVVCELMTLGQLSRWLKFLRAPKDRQCIADAYDLDEQVLVSFAHHLTAVRNLCAHHGRVWNRRLRLKMKIPKRKPLACFHNSTSTTITKIYNTLTMLSYLMSIISPTSTWQKRLKFLILSTPQIDVTTMGFPCRLGTEATLAGIKAKICLHRGLECRKLSDVHPPTPLSEAHQGGSVVM